MDETEQTLEQILESVKTFQDIPVILSQSQSSSSWNTYLASRKATKNRNRASHSENSTYALQCGKTHASPPSAGEAGKVGHNKCCDKKGKS